MTGNKRSILFVMETFKKIQYIRAESLKNGIELSFTQVVNDLCNEALERREKKYDT